MIHSSLPLYHWRYKCAMCGRHFTKPVKLLICEMIICGDCVADEKLQAFCRSEKCRFGRE